MVPERSLKPNTSRLLPAYVELLCILQPLLDVAGYWQQVLGLSNLPTLAIRTLLLVCSLVLGFLLSKRKLWYLLLAGVLGALTGLHVYVNLPGGFPEPAAELSNLVRIYTLPLFTLCFISFLRRDGEGVFRAMQRGMSWDLLIILAVELLSVLTGTDRGTYVKEQIGVIGWFVWGNCQSAILSMLTPLAICWTLRRRPKRLLPVALVTLGAEAALYCFGARLSFATLLASGLGVSVCLLILDRGAWKQALAVLLITALFLGAYPLSPAARRLQTLEENNEVHAQDASELQQSLPQEPRAAETLPPESLPAAAKPTEPAARNTASPETELESLETVYRYYFSAVVDRFGIERVAEKYNYTRDAEILGNVRICKRVACQLLMEDAPELCRYFGLPVSYLRLPIYGVPDEQSNYLVLKEYVSFEVENDFIGIYYLLGAVGLGLTVLFLLYFGLRALIRVLREPKRRFTLDMVGYAGAYVFALIHAWYTTSVLRRNNASIYLALVLAGLWYLSRKEPEKAAAPLKQEGPTQPERSANGTE